MDNNINRMFMFDPFKDYGKIIRKEFKRYHFLSALMEFDETLIELEIKAFEHDETDKLEKYVNKNHSAVLVLYDITIKEEENEKPQTGVVKSLLDKVTKFPPEVVKSLVTIEFRKKHDEIKKQAEEIAKSYNVPFYFIHEKSPEFYGLIDDIYIQTVNSILENIKKQPGRNIKEQTAELEEKKKEEEMKEQKDKLEGKEEDLSNTEKVTVVLLGKGEDELDYAKYWIIKFAFAIPQNWF